MKVEVYFNLHKKLFSVRALDGENRRRVIMHTPAIMLANAEYRVSEAGRQRVLRERRKNVHAFVRGELIAHGDHVRWCGLIAEDVTYNPYKAGHFERRRDGARVSRSDTVAMIVERGKALIRASQIEH